MKKYFTYLHIVIVVPLLTSCATQNLFQNQKHSSFISDSIPMSRVEHILKPDDKVTISIWNHDDLSIGSLFGVYNSNEVYGKWIIIDQNGEVDLPQIGKLKLGGLTTKNAEDSLRKKYSKLIVDPVIVLKVINMEITVLGEVFKPGTYTIDKDFNTVIELLGKAGGLDFYANKKQIHIIRGEGTTAKKFVLDLTSMENYKQNNLVLESGDIIFVPMRKGKMIDKKAPVIIPFATALTATLVLISFLKK